MFNLFKSIDSDPCYILGYSVFCAVPGYVLAVGVIIIFTVAVPPTGQLVTIGINRNKLD